MDDRAPDPRRWATLAIAIMSAFIVVLDTTVLNVSIPTILRDLHTTLPALEWVITGYALMFASLLIIGGRLGDVYGHRRIFVIGVTLFGIGSLVASVSTSVGELILGEAVIEGIGASLMLPSTLAILSGTFRGRERAAAFAAWGATAGVAAATGPVVGGLLTTDYSWRWSFRINVIVAPLAAIGALLFMVRGERGPRVRIDVPGALMVSVGMFLLVFGLSEGAVYGWWRPLEDLSVAGRVLWPGTLPISAIPVTFVLAAAVLGTFTWYELRKTRAAAGPLVDFSHLRFRTYRYGLLTTMVLAMGQLGVSFVLPVFLQDARHLSARTNGLWMLPSGLFVIVGAQVGGRLTHRFGTTRVVRWGLVMYATGTMLILRSVSVDITWLSLLPGLALYGAGIGFAGAQLTNVVLSEIPPAASGVASGSNTTMRQVGSALGVSVIGSLLTAKTIATAGSAISSSGIAATARDQALAGLHAAGSGYSPGAGMSAADAEKVRQAVEHGVVTGTRWALAFAVVVILAGTLLSRLIPTGPTALDAEATDGAEAALALPAAGSLVPEATG